MGEGQLPVDFTLCGLVATALVPAVLWLARALLKAKDAHAKDLMYLTRESRESREALLIELHLLREALVKKRHGEP